jgi:excisionase family DNA binding protein
MAAPNVRPEWLEPVPAEAHSKPLTVKQAASASNVSQSLIYDWCRRGLLRHIRLPGRNGHGWKILIAEDDLFAFLREHTVEPGPNYYDASLKHIRLPPSGSPRVRNS